MFNSSPRPTKRQRLNGSTLPSSPQTPKSSNQKLNRRSILTYGKRRSGKTPTNAGLASYEPEHVEANDEHEPTKDPFVDSAYQSMSTMQDEFNELADEVETPSRRGRRRRETATGKTKGAAIGVNGAGPETPRGQQRISVPDNKGESSSRETRKSIAHTDSASDGGTIVVRSSGRARKKTWKSAAADEEAATESTRKAHATLGRPDSTTVLHDSVLEKESSAKSPTSRAVPTDYNHSPQTPLRIALATEVATPQSKRKRGRPPKNRTSLEDSQDITASKSPTKATDVGKKTGGTVYDSINFEGAVATSSPAVQRASLSARPQGIALNGEESTLRIISERNDSESALADLNTLLENRKSHAVLATIKEEILGYLTNRRLRPIIGEDHKRAYHKVYQLLEQTVAAGEGNSMLLIGARGTAKSTAVETAVSKLVTQYREDFHVIRLNGFLQTDDKLALREIWRQLGKEMNVEDGSMDDKGNYADTLSSLLALLSQPEELSSSTDKRGSTSKSVIFVLNEFDLFTSHPRQTLLYNLFDIAQSRKAPIAVLGLTTRIDIVESLEKRVKSRFSHRYVYFTRPKTYSAYLDICKASLLACPTETELIDGTIVQTASLSYPASSIHHTFDSTNKTFHAAWSSYISSLLSHPSLQTQLKRTYHQTKSTTSFLNCALLPIAAMSPSNLPTFDSFLSHPLQAPDSKLELLPSISELELALLICAARLDVILDTDTCNFNMAYDEYTSLAQRAKMQSSAAGAIAIGGSQGGGRVWGREVAMGAWEALEELGLLVPATGVGGGAGGAAVGNADLGRGGRLMKADVSLEEIRDSRLEGLGGVLGRWCKEI